MLLFWVDVDKNDEITSCDCLQDCNSIEYEIQVIKTKLKYEHHYIEVNNASYWYNSTYNGALVVSFGDDEYTALKRYASYETISFLSNVGGLLSLFLGVSVMSFIEIFYVLIIRVMTEFVAFIIRKRKVKKVHVYESDLSTGLNHVNF